MLHELLFALLGHTGDIFIESVGEDGRPSFVVSGEAKDFVGVAERGLFNRILRTGYAFRELQKFVHRETEVNARGGVYRRDLDNGLSETLDKYRHLILQLEQKALSYNPPLLSTFQHVLSDFEVVLPALLDLVHQVQDSQVEGVKLLQIVHASVQWGIPELRIALKRIDWHCHTVLLKQLTAWLAHGMLLDEGREFLIAQGPHSITKAITPSKIPQTVHRTTSPQQSRMQLVSDSLMSDWESFRVRIDMLPPSIPLPVAERILFIGKAVRVLSNPPRGVGTKTVLKRDELLPPSDTSECHNSFRSLLENKTSAWDS